jgi:S1-C subfamily serine protease
MVRLTCAFVCMFAWIASGVSIAKDTTSLQLSRSAAVKVISQPDQSSGSGFFIDDQLVLTCFHVVASVTVQGNNIRWTLHPSLKISTPAGELIDATVISLPTEADASPLIQDFAVLKLKTKPTKRVSKLQIAAEKELPAVGDDVAFSGYPLATPGLVTHRGMISGHDELFDLIFIQAPINKGNSGGGLLNEQGHVVGIISNREGGISQGLQQLQIYIDQKASQGSVQIMGVDSLQVTKAIVQTLDQYISTGIGYARSIKFARDYVNANNLLPH